MQTGGPIDDSDTPDRAYTPTLKAIMSKINPHNISCLYKKAFEKHAVDSLIHCSEDNASNDRYEEAWYLESLLKKLPGYDMTGWGERGSHSADGDDFSTISPHGYCSNIEVNTSLDSHAKGLTAITPWGVCNVCHSQHHIASGLVSSASSISSDAHTRWIPRLNHATVLRKKAVSEAAQPGPSFGKWTNHGYIDGGEASNYGSLGIIRTSRTTKSARASRNKKPVNSDTAVSSNTYSGPDAQPVNRPSGTFRFKHEKCGTSYIKDYREQVMSGTKHQNTAKTADRLYSKEEERQPVNIPNTAYRVYSRGEERQPVPKVNVECDDVRDGACVRSTANNTNTIKVSNFDFQMNRKYNTQTPSNMRLYTHRARSRPSSSVSSTSSSPNKLTVGDIKDHALLLAVGKGHSPVCTSPTKDKERPSDEETPTSINESPAISLFGSWSNRNTVVSRSRPSIPSNAKGVICPSAIEMPLHVVSCGSGHNARKTPMSVRGPHSLPTSASYTAPKERNTTPDDLK